MEKADTKSNSFDFDIISYQYQSKKDYGIVESIGDGIVGINGLSNVANGEMIVFVINENTFVEGLVMNLEEESISAIVLGDDLEIKPGNFVFSKNKLMCIPVGESLLGRIIDPLGNVLDGLGELTSTNSRNVEVIAPSIISRTSVNLPLETGLKVVDSLVPIGHGQRELIIGDGKTGKTTVAIDTIINQKGKDTICIYVAIGQKRSSIARLAKILQTRNCLQYTIIVAATSSDSAALQFLAPYSGCSIGEYFMHNGLKVLVVYDDLSKHAVSYRQISLLLRRPPGREGFPGDVFYLHSRLLERSANLKQSGSLTALPIIETIQGDVSAYIPTNVISITDGQIFLETELFSRGIRPAVSPGLSVSRVGSAAQNKVIRKMSSSLKLLLAQYREVEDFARLGFVLDEATKQLIDTGSKLTSLLIQNKYNPIDISYQIFLLFASLNGFLVTIPTQFIESYEKALFKFLDNTFFGEPLKYQLVFEMEQEILIYLLNIFNKYFKKTYLSKI
jgi:F-type H+-transporting ATPase subunit alpha